MPATLKPKRTESARPRPAVVRPEASKLSEDRAAYRRTGAAGGDKKADVGPGANPNLEFVSSKFSFLVECMKIYENKIILLFYEF